MSPAKSHTMSPAIFLDRDGTICEEVGYLGDPDRLRLLPGSARAIRLINESPYRAVVVTNQAGVARGLFPESRILEVNDRLRELLALEDARVDGLYYCPHHPDHGEPPYRARCGCRKPETGMIDQAASEMTLHLPGSYLIGDKRVDVQCAQAAGMKGVLVRTGYGAEELENREAWTCDPPHIIADDLLAAVERILAGGEHPQYP